MTITASQKRSARPEAAVSGSARARFRPLPVLLLLPGVVLVGLLAVGLAAVFDDSFRTLDRTTFLLGQEWTLANYKTILSEPIYRTVFGRTILGAAVTTAITISLAFPYAYVLVRTESRTRRKLLLLALFMPFTIGQLVRAYSWIIVLGRNGFVNELLGFFDIPPIGFLYNFGAVVFGLSQYLVPTAVLLMVPAMVAIRRDFEDASTNLGAHWVETLRYVVLPMARPGLVAAALVVFTISLTDFAFPAMMGGGRADFASNLIHSTYLQLSDPGLGAAISIVLVALGSLLVVPMLLYPRGRATKRTG